MSGDVWEGGTLRINWSADALPDGGGSRLLRDARAELAMLGRRPEPAEWHAAVLRASAWARPERPLVAIIEPRLVNFRFEDASDPPTLFVDIAVAPVASPEARTLAGWRTWWERDGQLHQPDVPVAPGETTYITRLTVARVAGDALRTRAVDLSQAGVRAALEAVIAAIDDLATAALVRFAGPIT
ncbi:MAG TPA: hypothetical protein VNT55_14705 [Baekduia sp.]|nr:hypothetical protein [Baekduia sp.]